VTKTKKYANATAFRRALEDRLKTIANKEHTDLQRLRRQVAFDRFLARLFKGESPWVLKGGYALEIHLKESRTTRDIDLAWQEAFHKRNGSPNEIVLEALQDAAAIDLGDFFVFTVGEPTQDIETAPYGGARFPISARMDNRLFVTFHVDMGLGDVIITPPENAKGKDWLHFAGIPPAKFKTIPKEQHFAEKLHAYTQPRQNPNSRVRDLIDMVLLIKSAKLNSAKVRKALEATFKKRHTHILPKNLETPSHEWNKPFLNLSKECNLPMNLDSAFNMVEIYYKKIK